MSSLPVIRQSTWLFLKTTPRSLVLGGGGAQPIIFACPPPQPSSSRRNSSHAEKPDTHTRCRILIRRLRLSRSKPQRRPAEKYSPHRRTRAGKRHHQLPYRTKTHFRHHPRISRRHALQNHVRPHRRRCCPARQSRNSRSRPTSLRHSERRRHHHARHRPLR